MYTTASPLKQAMSQCALAEGRDGELQGVGGTAKGHVARHYRRLSRRGGGEGGRGARGLCLRRWCRHEDVCNNRVLNLPRPHAPGTNPTSAPRAGARARSLSLSWLTRAAAAAAAGRRGYAAVRAHVPQGMRTHQRENTSFRNRFSGPRSLAVCVCVWCRRQEQRPARDAGACD